MKTDLSEPEWLSLGTCIYTLPSEHRRRILGIAKLSDRTKLSAEMSLVAEHIISSLVEVDEKEAELSGDTHAFASFMVFSFLRSRIDELGTLSDDQTRGRLMAKEGSIDWAYKFAASDPLAYQIAARWTAYCVESNQELTSGQKAFLTDLLSGVIEPPKRKPGKRPAPFRDELIVRAVLVATGLGLKATRNDVSSHAASACDVVADQLLALGQGSMGYFNVKRIWLAKRGHVNIQFPLAMLGLP